MRGRVQLQHAQFESRLGLVAWLHAACGRCEYCRRGAENLCVAPRFTGWTDPGGYADARGAPEDFVYRLPDALSTAVAAPMLCAGIIGYRALVRSGIRPGQALGLYGRVSVASWNGRRLPYIENFINLSVVSGRESVDKEEILRVPCPGGVAVFLNAEFEIQNPKLAKPWPREIDQWTHYLHGPDNTGEEVARVVSSRRQRHAYITRHDAGRI